VKLLAQLTLLCGLCCLTRLAAADAVDDLVGKLKSKDVETRVDACAALAKLGPAAKNAVAPLINVVNKDSSKLARKAAIEALGAIGPLAGSAASPLLTVFKAEAELRPEAGKALGRIGGQTAVTGLTVLLPAEKKGNDNALRTAAAMALAEFGPDAKAAVKALHGLLTEKDAGLKTAAIVALGRIGPATREAIPDLLELLTDGDMAQKLAAIDAVGRIGAESKISVKALTGLLDSPDAQIATLAVEGLARMGKNGTAVLAERLKNPDVKQRLLILRALVATKSDARGAVAELLALTADENPEVQRLARSALDGLGKGAATDLVKLLKDPAQPDATRLRAAAVLAKLEPGKENLADLGRLLKDPKVEVRRAAAESLGRLGPDAADALPELVGAMRDDDGAVRSGVGRAIKNTGRKGSAKLQALQAAATEVAVIANLGIALRLTEFGSGKDTVPALVAALSDKEDIVARVAAETLGSLGEPALAPLMEALKERKPPVRRYAAMALKEMGAKAKKAVPLLTEALRDSDGPTREFAALALGAMGLEARPATAELIKGMLNDPDKELRVRFAQALIQVDPDPKLAAPAFRQALRDKQTADCATEGLIKLGSAAVPELSAALKDKDEDVRRTAVEILGSLGAAARPAVPTLLEATRDANPRIGAAARRVLESIFLARTLQLLNDLRTKAHRSPMTLDPILMRVTLEHAKLMAKEKKTDPMPPKTPVERARDAGYQFSNIGLLQLPVRDLDADPFFDALINSKIIDQLSKPEFSEIGIGLDGDDAGNYYVAILYASKPPKK
jgi:HEAT repeat protein